MAKSEELDWLMGPPQLKFGDIKKKIWNYVSLGDTIYITGELILNGNQGEALDSIYLENEPAIVIKKRASGWENVLDVAFGENVTNTQVWYDNMPDDDGKVDLGSVEADDDLLITLPNKPINESEEFDWTDDFQWTTDMLYSMLENCNEIKVSNYSLEMDSAYKSLGGPVIYTLTRCKEWWDRFSTIELDDSGRGPAEWYDDYDDGRIGLISPYGTKNKNIRDIDWEDIDNREGWTISQEPYQIVNSLNGKGSELFILLDDKGRPVYDLIPKEHRERIKTNWEDRFYGKNINESDEDPLKWIKDVKTNQDIAKEIYDGLKWSKEEDTYFVRNQWNGIPFSVRPFEKGRDKIILSPSSFHKNYRKYMIEKWGIYEIDNAKEIYFSLRKLIAQKIHNNLNESKDFEWTDSISDRPLHNVTFKVKGYPETLYTIKDSGLRSSVKIKWVTNTGFMMDGDWSDGIKEESTYMRDAVNKFFKIGEWIPTEGPITESKDLDWIKDIEAEGLNKKNSYVVDVRDLKPAPMRFSHDPTLTRQDILRHLEDFGYDVKGHDVDRIAFLYIEPSDDAGYWDGPVWVKQKYWVDWDEDNIKDPTYGGKYQMIDVDELMFFIDNNFISESSELGWLQNMGEPMSICEAYPQVKAGDTIIVSSLGAWEDSSDEELLGVNNATATVLAVDKCNEIQPNNFSTNSTILVHFNEPYTGFDELWVREFKHEYREACTDGRCMFLICDDDDDFYNKVKITNLGSNILGENKKEDLNWVSDTTNKVQTTGVDHDGNIISLQKVYFDFLKTIAKVEDNYDPRLESNATLDTKYTRKVKDYLNLNSRTYQALGGELLLIGLDKAFKMYFDKKPTKTLTEAAGISFEARKWGETIYNEIMNNPDEKKRLIIDGYNHPEAFNGFPIDYVVIDFYDKLTGYGQEHSGYDKDGNYVVHLYVQPGLLQGQGVFNLKSTLNHEMKHAWEDYNRLSKGLPSIEHTKESQELYNKDFILMLSDQNIVGPIKEILKYYYYLSNLEKSAYLENVYDQNPYYERVVRDIARKDFESFKDSLDLDIDWHLMNTAYDIPFLKKFKSPREFIDYSAEELRSKAVKIIKKINKMRYIHGK